MTDTLERELRRTLADHAPATAAPGPDPWQRVQRGVVRRRRRRTGALAGSLALVVALGGGLAVVRPWAGEGGRDEIASPVTSGWALDDGVPRGALAGDEELRAAVEQGLSFSVAATSRPVRGSLRLVFADDVAGTRLVVATARFQPEDEDASMVLVGPAGSPPDELMLQGAITDRTGAVPAVAVTVVAEDGPRLLAVVPRGARVSVSDAVQVDAAGERIFREWRPVEVSADGLVDTALTSRQGAGEAVLRIESAPGLDGDAPVAELSREWPASGSADEARRVAAVEVVARGPQAFRDGLVPQPVPDAVRGARPGLTDRLEQSVASAMREAGTTSAQDTRLLYASMDGADDRGATGWSTLTEVQAGDGSVVVWDWHPGGNNGMVRTVAVPSPSDASAERLLLRVPASTDRDLVGVWDPEGTLGTVTVDGEDLVMPDALGFRWFPVAAGSRVTVDGEDVPAAQREEDPAVWPLPGEERPGPAPRFVDVP